MTNPALSNVLEYRGEGRRSREALTLDHVATAALFLLALSVVSGALAAVLVPAAATWSVIAVGGLAALAFSVVLGFTALKFNPVAVGAFAVLEGVVLGVLTRLYSDLYDGVVTGAVLGTVAASFGVLVAFKVGARASDRMRRMVFAGMVGLVAVGLANGALVLFGGPVGFLGYGLLGVVFSLAGLVLGVLSLLGDFTDIEKQVAARAPVEYRWALSWGLLVSLVWMYTNLLRLLAIFDH